MSKFLVQVLHTFPGVPRSLNYITMKIHLNHCKDSSCSFNFSFYHPFITGVLMKALHGGSSNISFLLLVFIEILFRAAKVFFILHFKVQSLLPYLVRWCYVILDNFPSCFTIHKLSRMRYFKPIIFFVGVILVKISPKILPKGMLLIVVSNNNSSFSPILSAREDFISSLISSKQLFSLVAEFHRKF